MAATMVAFLGAGCTEVNRTPATQAAASHQEAGALIRSAPLTSVDPSIAQLGPRAVRMTYYSTSAQNNGVAEVTGAAFIPKGDAPPGGWPVMAIGHGSVGINTECAPSLDSDLHGLAAVVAGFLAAGYAVTVADYQGLGGPGSHPYLDPKTAGFDIIDSVRAVRGVSNQVSKLWGAFGISQGGAAVWSANEQAAVYAPELQLVGTVSVAPSVDVSPYVAMAHDGTLNIQQRSAYVWLLEALRRTQPVFNLDEYRNGISPTTWQQLETCALPDAATRQAALASLSPDQTKPATPEAEQRLTTILSGMALPQRRTTAPMLVIYGGRDAYIDPKWIESAIAKSCAMGSWIGFIFQPDNGHDDLDANPLYPWFAARFNRYPAASNCFAR